MAKVLIPTYLEHNTYQQVVALTEALNQKNYSQTISFLVKLAIRRLEEQAYQRKTRELQKKFNLEEYNAEK